MKHKRERERERESGLLLLRRAAVI
jgi:hypothetical protein